MEWLNLGMREIILLLVVVAAVYLVIAVLKLIQVGRRQSDEMRPAESYSASAPVPAGSRTALAAYAEAMVETETAELPRQLAVPPEPMFDWDDVKELFGEPAPSRMSVEPVPATRKQATGFGESLSAHLARSEMETELQHMRTEMARMRKEVEDLRRAQQVSPHYAEATELVQRGLSARDVAARLEISLAEAELVQALSRSAAQFDEGEADGGERNTAGNRRSAG